MACSSAHARSPAARSAISPPGTQVIQIPFSADEAGVEGVHVAVTSIDSNINPNDTSGVATTTVLPCTIVGTDGPDHLKGTDAVDRICGRPGADWISGGAGNDYLDGGSGADTIFGGPGHDTILGRGGRDVIFARDGQRDYIDCGTEYDIAVVDRFDHVRNCERVLRK
jgi:hypothetical protein